MGRKENGERHPLRPVAVGTVEADGPSSREREEQHEAGQAANTTRDAKQNNRFLLSLFRAQRWLLHIRILPAARYVHHLCRWRHTRTKEFPPYRRVAWTVRRVRVAVLKCRGAVVDGYEPWRSHPTICSVAALSSPHAPVVMCRRWGTDSSICSNPTRSDQWFTIFRKGANRPQPFARLKRAKFDARASPRAHTLNSSCAAETPVPLRHPRLQLCGVSHCALYAAAVPRDAGATPPFPPPPPTSRPPFRHFCSRPPTRP